MHCTQTKLRERKKKGKQKIRATAKPNFCPVYIKERVGEGKGRKRKEEKKKAIKGKKVLILNVSGIRAMVKLVNRRLILQPSTTLELSL